MRGLVSAGLACILEGNFADRISSLTELTNLEPLSLADWSSSQDSIWRAIKVLLEPTAPEAFRHCLAASSH